MKSARQLFILSILKTFTTIVFVIVALLPVTAQFVDDFSDGDFTHNPVWQGDVTDFYVDAGELRLNADVGKTQAYLSTDQPGTYGTWGFSLAYQFNPSGSNFARIYLMSTEPDPAGPLEGYFILAGGPDDDVSLYRQAGFSQTRIIDGSNGRLDLNTVSVHVVVTRSAEGEWEILTKVGAESDFHKEGSVSDNTIWRSTYFVIQCNFTSTRSDKFIFDHVRAETSTPPDEVPPSLEALRMISATRLEVQFTEPVAPAAVRTDNFSVIPTGGEPYLAELNLDGTTVTLEFQAPFITGTHYTLTIHEAADAAGNVAAGLQVPFTFALPAAAAFKDVIMTEIFPDPSPPVSLPEAEFVEIHNRSDKAIDLTNWTISDNGSTGKLTGLVLMPGQYLILRGSGETRFDAFGLEMAITGFPSLNNAGDILVLRDNNGETIDSVNYGNWYRDSEKAGGGWTLEIIDPSNICAEEENWIASDDPTGGTPGKRNSVYAEKPDLTGPVLTKAIPVHETMLMLAFNEKLERRVPPLSAFTISQGIVVDDVALSADLRVLLLTISPRLVSEKAYDVTVSEIYDCAGNLISPASGHLRFGLPEPADSLDVVVNELLFNPFPGGVDFVEIVNRSSKYIDLADWKVANLENGIPRNARPVSAEAFLFAPGELKAFTSDIDILLNHYPFANASNLVRTTLPSFNDDSGSVCLVSPEGKVIDLLQYTANMHSRFIRDKSGVSLERIDVNQSSADAANWKSGSSQTGFATPGDVNASRMSPARENNKFVVEPEIFLPLSGQLDFTTIAYSLDQAGFLVNIVIHDARGRKIKTLTQGALLGNTGFFRWDGDQDDGSKARVGSYMIRIELFDHRGVQETIMKRVAIAGRW